MTVVQCCCHGSIEIIMKTIIKVEKEVNITTLEVNAGVRYWEDSEINGESDTEDGDNIPCKDGDRWKPIIDIDKGIITNWEQGKTASIHYKVCDDGIYTLKDEKGNTIEERNNYVPNIMCPGEDGYGDYIIMNIGSNGEIEDWDPDLSDFFEED